jgi:hypothetical protein
MKENYIMPIKDCVTTAAIKAELVCGVDGQIFDPHTLEKDVAKLLKEQGYKMSLEKALDRIKTFSRRKEQEAYGPQLVVLSNGHKFFDWV